MQNVNSLRTKKAQSFLMIATAVAATAGVSLAGQAMQGPTGPHGRIDQRVLTFESFDPAISGPSHGHATGDATKTYTGGGSTNLFSNPTNFGGSALVNGDDLVFGPTPTGDYTVNNDTTFTYGLVTETRATPTETVTLQGGINATAVQVATGKLTFDGVSTTNLSGAGTALNNISLFAGSVQGGNATITLQNGAIVNGNDFLAGGRAFSNGATPPVITTTTSTGVINVTGTAKFQPLVLGVTDSFFGSTNGTATVNVTNGGTVSAFYGLMNDQGSMNVNTGGSITLNALSGTPSTATLTRFQAGAGTGANVAVNISGGSIVAKDNPLASSSVFNQLSRDVFGIGANSTTTATISNGGLFQGGIISFGGTDSTIAGATSASTMTITGANSRVIATDSFGTSGTARFTNLYNGITTLSILNGGSLTAANFVSINGADRLTALAPNPVTGALTDSSTVLIDGANSKVTVRNAAGNGTWYSNYGDRTSSTITVSNGGLIDVDQFGLGVSLVGGASDVRINGGRVVTNGIFGGDTGNADKLTISNGGTVDATGAGFFEITAGAGGSFDLLVTGATSHFTASGQTVTGGFSADNGSGRATLVASGGSTMTFGTIFTGGSVPADGSTVDPAGTTITATGAGTKIFVNGYSRTSTATPPVTTNFAATVSIADGPYSVATLNVLAGATMTSNQTAPTPNPDPTLPPIGFDFRGVLLVASDEAATGTVNVDGAGSTLLAGRLIEVARTPDGTGSALPFGNATGVINVKNGGRLNTTGNLQLSITAGDNLHATLNIGVDSTVATPGASDGLTRVEAGSVLVGGSTATGASSPTVGSPAVINIYNGKFDVGATFVYAGSNVNFRKGVIDSGTIAARGGSFTISPTSAPGTAVYIADNYQATFGGVIDIGRSGGILRTGTTSTPTTGATTLAELKSLIVAGLGQGVNSIRSTAIVGSSTLSVGYADVRISNITTFLGQAIPSTQTGYAFRTTLKGDANVDGTVSFSDLLLLAQNFGGTGKEWFQGDFNYSGGVDFADLLSLAQNFGATYNPGGSITLDLTLNGEFAADWALAQQLAVPEPTSFGLLVAAGAIAARRRRA